MCQPQASKKSAIDVYISGELQARSDLRDLRCVIRMRNSQSELILACFAKNAADRIFSNSAFYAAEVLTLVPDA